MVVEVEQVRNLLGLRGQLDAAKFGRLGVRKVQSQDPDFGGGGKAHEVAPRSQVEVLDVVFCLKLRKLQR